MLGRTPRSLLVAALALAAGGCPSNDETTPNPDDPQKIAIELGFVNPNPCSCAQVIEVADTAHPRVLPIQVKVGGTGASQFVLRPPGYCRLGGYSQCGHLVATVSRFDSQDPAKVVENIISKSSTTVIEVPLSGPGDVSINVTVFDDDDKQVIAESPVVRVSTQTACPQPDENGQCPSSSSSGGGMGGGGGSSSSSSSSSGMGAGGSDAGADGG
jgi:uncharacterized membrane protein YgcG